MFTRFSIPPSSGGFHNFKLTPAGWQAVRRNSVFNLVGVNVKVNDSSETGIAAFWLRVKTNLQAGRVRMIFVADEIPFEHAAIMMCSSATSLHALNKARIEPGESVAVFGAGGLGMSAIQLAKALGAREVFVLTVARA